jgi:hypothetical protein
MQAFEIVILVAATALNCVSSVPIWSTPDPHGVGMTVVTLAGIIANGMTIHTSWMTKHTNHRLKRFCASVIVALIGCFWSGRSLFGRTASDTLSDDHQES